jgi:toxin ParE1/3/4
MRRFRFTLRAERDIEEIGDFIARDNPMRAVTFISELTERCEQLIEHPVAAPLRPEFGPGVRMVPFGRYLIFYMFESSLLEIIRVVHGARNWTEQQE